MPNFIKAEHKFYNLSNIAAFRLNNNSPEYLATLPDEGTKKAVWHELPGELFNHIVADYEAYGFCAVDIYLINLAMVRTVSTDSTPEIQFTTGERVTLDSNSIIELTGIIGNGVADVTPAIYDRQAWERQQAAAKEATTEYWKNLTWIRRVISSSNELFDPVGQVVTLFDTGNLGNPRPEEVSYEFCVNLDSEDYSRVKTALATTIEINNELFNEGLNIVSRLQTVLYLQRLDVTLSSIRTQAINQLTALFGSEYAAGMFFLFLANCNNPDNLRNWFNVYEGQ